MSAKHFYRRGASAYRYRSISGSLYRFKYEGRREYADYYALEMARALERFLDEEGPLHTPQALVPVPCSARKMRTRGYNQAAVLAEKLAEKADNNLKKAFHAYGNSVRLKSIMLIDDIYTTGATIDACARTLLEAGAEEVNFLTLAIGENSL